MKNYRVLAMLILALSFCGKGHAQIGVIADRAYILDTFRMHSWSASLGLIFYVNDDEMKDHTGFRFAGSAHGLYLFKNSDIELSVRQMVERESDATWTSNNLVLLSAGIFKYKPLSDQKAVLRKFYPEPVFIYQNNSDRGLRMRFQTGILLHPWSFYRPKFNFNIGVGIVRDWSSWEVNNPSEISAADPALRDKINFINSRVKLRKNMYQDHSEWRPMLLLTMDYRVNPYVRFTLNTSYQQSLASPYSIEIRAAYPDLAKVYPYILTQLDMSVKVYRGVSMTISASVDYENSNLCLYKSSWAYNTLVGFSWAFSNQKPR